MKTSFTEESSISFGKNRAIISSTIVLGEEAPHTTVTIVNKAPLAMGLSYESPFDPIEVSTFTELNETLSEINDNVKKDIYKDVDNILTLTGKLVEISLEKNYPLFGRTRYIVRASMGGMIYSDLLPNITADVCRILEAVNTVSQKAIDKANMLK